MPRPKRINSRKLWDRWAIDRSFEELPDDGDERSLSPDELYLRWKAEDAERRSGPVPDGDTPREDTVISDGYLWSRKEFAEYLTNKPLNRRERDGLKALYASRGNLVPSEKTKGAGLGTMERLATRGYVVIEVQDERYLGARITKEGEAAYEEMLRPEGHL